MLRLKVPLRLSQIASPFGPDWAIPEATLCLCHQNSDVYCGNLFFKRRRPDIGPQWPAMVRILFVHMYLSSGDTGLSSLTSLVPLLPLVPKPPPATRFYSDIIF